MTSRRAVVLVLLAAAVPAAALVGGLAAGSGIVGADHGDPDADFTVEPMDDRSPGATDVKYGQVVVGQTGEDYRTLESMEAVYEEGSWQGCGPDDSEVFGIDRGNTHDGYEVDEELQENVKTFSAGEDVFSVEFYGEDDFGPTTHLDSGDAVVSVAKCIDNPEEPGWYQISGSTTGVTEDGDEKTVRGESHYFWVCDCEDEAEAREELGPPPSEPEQTETPQGTTESDGGSDDESSGGSSSGAGSPDAADGDDEPSDDGSTEDGASATGGGEDTSTAEPTATVESAGGSGSSGSQQPAASGDRAKSWDEHRIRTPTPGDGDGFGGGLALLAFVGTALLFARRA